MSEQDRRARNAEYSRAYRARKRAERLSAAEQADESATVGTMREAVERSIAAARWLRDSDRALVEMARRQANLVDSLTRTSSIAALLRAHGALTKTLESLAATPTARLRYELQSRRTETKPAGEQRALGNNVTRFPRPAKTADRDR